MKNKKRFLVFAMIVMVCTTFAAYIPNSAHAANQAVRVSGGSNDAEECSTNNAVDSTSSDLELVGGTSDCNGGTQQVGMRFQNIAIPKGAVITNASIQFTADEAQSGFTSLMFFGQAIDSASPFSSVSGNISNRTKTSSSVAWNNIPAWNSVGQAGSNQKTPNLASIIQEIVDRPGWTNGNSIAIIVIGSGHRTAESYDGSMSKAPLLELEWGATSNPSSSTSSSIPPSGGSEDSVAYWKFDESGGIYATDSSGNGNYGILVNSPARISGVLGNALRFNEAQSESIAVNHSDSLNFGNGSFSIAFWIKYTDAIDADILRKGSTGTAVAWYKVEVPGVSQRLSFNVRTSPTSDVTVTAPNPTNDGQWYHVAAVRDTGNGKLRLYIDGVQVASKNNPTGSVSNSADLAIGSKDTLDDDFFNGVLDDVSLYNRALSPQEIIEFYEAVSSPASNISISPTSTAATQAVRVSGGSNDAEECSTNNGVDSTSSDLELVGGTADCNGGTQQVGMRFQNIAIPKGATITNAFIQFTADEIQSESTTLNLKGEDIDNSDTFISSSMNISNRTKTSSSVVWNNIPAWNTVGQAGSNQKTPNIASIIQEIVNRPGWSSGNSIAIIVTGSGHRTAESYNGSSSQAPLLELEWQ